MSEEIAPGSRIEFSLQTPCSDDVCRANIALSLGLHLPEVKARKRLTVIAGGPSAKYALPCEGDTVALNGALRLFTKQGLSPTYWACCDPQPLVADFLAEAPYDTVYLVASKCDPSVFERLALHRVRLWHVRDYPVPGKFRQVLAESVTMSSMWMKKMATSFCLFHRVQVQGSMVIAVKPVLIMSLCTVWYHSCGALHSPCTALSKRT